MNTDEPALTPGTYFAGYEVVRPLGEGGFGAVYEAISPDRTRRVALKVLRAEVSANDEVVARFLREANAVRELRHPNIVEAVDMGNYNGCPYLAMELLEGESLTELVGREGRLSLERALDILVPVMSAVRCVHAQNVVHRDLKPDNIFLVHTLMGTVVPKLLDFGFAKIQQPGAQITRNDTTIGTPNFMSPEQLHSPLAVDPRSDQWALGVLLYFLLTGEKPFAGSSVVETLKNVLYRNPVPLRARRPDVPPEVEAVVLRAIQKPADERFPSVQEMASALVPFTSDEVALMYSSEFVAEGVWDDEPKTNPMMAVFAAPAARSTPPPQQHPPLRAHQSTPPPARSPMSSAPPAPHSLQPVAGVPRAQPTSANSGRAIGAAVAIAFGLIGIALVGAWILRSPEDISQYASPGVQAVDAAGDVPDAARD